CGRWNRSFGCAKSFPRPDIYCFAKHRPDQELPESTLNAWTCRICEGCPRRSVVCTTFAAETLPLAAVRLFPRPRQRMVQPSFQHPCLGIEAGYLAHPIGGWIIGLLRNQPDQLALRDRNAMASRQFPHPAVNLRNGNGAVVGNIHAELRAPVDADPDGFDAVQPSIRCADGAGNGANGADLGLR